MQLRKEKWVKDYYKQEMRKIEILQHTHGMISYLCFYVEVLLWWVEYLLFAKQNNSDNLLLHKCEIQFP